jgi:hypothetical protein
MISLVNQTAMHPEGIEPPTHSLECDLVRLIVFRNHFTKNYLAIRTSDAADIEKACSITAQ